MILLIKTSIGWGYCRLPSATIFHLDKCVSYSNNPYLTNQNWLNKYVLDWPKPQPI